METLQTLFEGIILVVQIHEIVFNCHSPQGSCFELLFVHFCVSLLFLSSSISWKPFDSFTIIFYKCSWYFSEGYLTKETFSQHSTSLLGAMLRYFGAHFWGMLFYSWELFRILSYKTMRRHFLYYSDSQCAKKNVTARITLLVALCNIFRPFQYIPQCLEKLKTFSWHFVWMSYYYCGAH